MSSDDVTQMFKALGDPTRRAIFEFLCERCCPVAVEESGEVHPIQGASVGEVCCHVTGGDKFSSTVSFHIRELRLAGLIHSKRSGKFIVCSVRREAVDSMVAYLGSLSNSEQTSCDLEAHL